MTQILKIFEMTSKVDSFRNILEVHLKWSGYVKCSKRSEKIIFLYFVANRQILDNLWPLWTFFDFFLYFFDFLLFVDLSKASRTQNCIQKLILCFDMFGARFNLSFKKKIMYFWLKLNSVVSTKVFMFLMILLFLLPLWRNLAFGKNLLKI